MYVGGCQKARPEKDLLTTYAFGEVKAIRSRRKRCAFVTFATRAMAEKAARTTRSGLR